MARMKNISIVQFSRKLYRINENFINPNDFQILKLRLDFSITTEPSDIKENGMKRYTK